MGQSSKIPRGNIEEMIEWIDKSDAHDEKHNSFQLKAGLNVVELKSRVLESHSTFGDQNNFTAEKVFYELNVSKRTINFLDFLNFIYLVEAKRFGFQKHDMLLYNMFLPLFKCFDKDTMCRIEQFSFSRGEDYPLDHLKRLKLNSLMISFKSCFSVEIDGYPGVFHLGKAYFAFSPSVVTCDDFDAKRQFSFSMWLNRPNQTENTSGISISTSWLNNCDLLMIPCLNSTRWRFVRQWEMFSNDASFVVLVNPLRCRFSLRTLCRIVGKTDIIVFPGCQHIIVLKDENYFLKTILIDGRIPFDCEIPEPRMLGILHGGNVFESMTIGENYGFPISKIGFKSSLHPINVKFWFDYFNIQVPHSLDLDDKRFSYNENNLETSTVRVCSKRIILTICQETITEIIINFETRDIYLDDALILDAQVGADIYSRMRFFTHWRDTKFMFDEF